MGAWVWMIGAIMNVNTGRTGEGSLFVAGGRYPLYGRGCPDQTV